MADPRFPTMGDPSTWGEFDPNDPFNAACETERKLALRHVDHRLGKRQCNPVALMTGMMMATVQSFAAVTGLDMIPDEDRAKLHELLDFAMIAGVDGFHRGGTKQ